MLNSVSAIKRIIKQIWFIFEPKERLEALKVFIAMIFVALLELLGVSVIYSFISALLSPELLRGIWYSKWIFCVIPNIEYNHVIVILGIELILIYIIKNALALFFTYIQLSFSGRFQENESTRMLSAYLHRPYQFFLNTNSGAILRGINEDTNSVYFILIFMFQLCSEIVTIAVLSIYLVIIDTIMALSILGIAMVCFLLMFIFLKKRIKKSGRARRKALAERNKYSYQAIMGVKEIFVLRKRDFFEEKYRSSARDFAKTTIADGFYSECPNRIIEGVCIAGFVGIVCVRVLCGVDMNVFIPIVSSFAVVAFKILPELSKVSSRVNRIIFHQPGLQHFYDNVSRCPKSRFNNKSINKVNINKKNVYDNFTKELILDSVQFKYPNSMDIQIKDININIHKGESVAIIGPSGGGKTTLANIILGLLRPVEGKVLLDGKDIYEDDVDISKIIGFVPQDVFLLDDTIKNNIAFGVDENNIEDNIIWDLLEQAQLKDFVSSLPNGLNTIVGEKGIRFSGGQRQRIAIARALYNNPSIIIFDEATSALDSDTESAIIESIEQLKGKITLIIIAHRINTIKNCDRIYEVKNGKASIKNYKEVFK